MTHISIHNNTMSVILRRKEMFYLMIHSKHFIYGYMASDIWLRTPQIMREETCWHHFMSHSYQLASRDLLYTLSQRQESTYHGLCYTNCGELAGTRKSSMDPSRSICLRIQCIMRKCSTTRLLHYIGICITSGGT